MLLVDNHRLIFPHHLLNGQLPSRGKDPRCQRSQRRAFCEAREVTLKVTRDTFFVHNGRTANACLPTPQR
jgi:hypothetical protein